MPNILDEILAHKRREVEQARAATPLEVLQERQLYQMPRRNFYGSVAAPKPRGPNLIAEIKHKSPSAGVIVPDFDPVTIARTYEAAGACALSVLTDERYFGGAPEFIERVKQAVSLPVLRKDFIVDPWQVYESRAIGADCILLIGEALEGERITELTVLAHQLELCVLVEVHARDVLMKVLQALPHEWRSTMLLGINNRDLAVQRVDLTTTERLAELVPPGLPIVSESGMKSRQDVERMHRAGARALLIGETLLRGDPARNIRDLFG